MLIMTMSMQTILVMIIIMNLTIIVLEMNQMKEIMEITMSMVTIPVIPVRKSPLLQTLNTVLAIQPLLSFLTKMETRG